MIAEKSHTAQLLIEKISATAPKVGFINSEVLTRAFLQLENKGIPNNKHEDYKYCNLDVILKKEFKDPTQKFTDVGKIDAFRLKNAFVLVLVNGQYSSALSDKTLPPGLEVKAFVDTDASARQKISSIADGTSDSFVALNTVFCGNGLHLKVTKGVTLQTTIQILYVSACNGEALVNPRTLIELEENATATLVEQHVLVGEGKIFSNSLSEKFIGHRAKLTSYIFQNEGGSGYSVNTQEVKVDKEGHYNNTTLTLSGQVVRNNHQVVLAGEHSEAHLNGLFSCKGQQLVDNHTLMDHRVPHCESNELYKGIINDKSTAVFNGKIFVRKDAQKTNAYQSSKNILLSDDATINTKPQLEIYANDVKCSHGTSTGRIDENALFYLNARGIGKETGRKLLLASFAGEVIDTITVPELKEIIAHLFENEI